MCARKRTNSMQSILFEKLVVPQLVKKLPVFFGTGRFSTSSTTSLYFFLSWTRSTKSTSSPSYLLKIHFIIIILRRKTVENNATTTKGNAIKSSKSLMTFEITYRLLPVLFRLRICFLWRSMVELYITAVTEWPSDVISFAVVSWLGVMDSHRACKLTGQSSAGCCCC